MKFNEDSRVKIPTILHLIRLGYTYLSLTNQKWDESNNIFTDIFNKNISKINPELNEGDIKRCYDEVSLSLENEDLGKVLVPVSCKISDAVASRYLLSVKKGSLSSYIDMNALPESGFMTKEIQKKEFNGGMKFQNGDLAIARITPCLENGKTGLITLLGDSEIGFGSTEFIILRGKEFDLRSFGACLSRSEKFRRYAISKMTGTTGRKRVSSTDLESFEMTVPKNEILKKFESLVSPFFEKTKCNVKENQKLSELRDWLLPMLMNGQVKVGDAERELAMAAEPEGVYKRTKK